MRRLRAFGTTFSLAAMSAVACWMVSTICTVVLALLASWGPGVFLGFMARPALALALIVAAFTAPAWLLALVSVVLRERQPAVPSPASQVHMSVVPRPAPDAGPLPDKPPILLTVALLAGLYAVQWSHAAQDVRGFTIVQAAVSFALAAVLGALWRWRVVSLRRRPAHQP